MSRKEYLMMTYDSYFDRLETIAESIDLLKAAAQRLTGNEKDKILEHVSLLEREMEDYATYVSTSGVDVIRNVA